MRSKAYKASERSFGEEFGEEIFFPPRIDLLSFSASPSSFLGVWGRQRVKMGHLPGGLQGSGPWCRMWVASKLSI